MFEQLQNLQGFFHKGGAILWGILGLSFVLWITITERYIKLSAFRRHRNMVLQSPLNVRIQAARTLQTGLPMVATLVSVLPLLGLLGTVIGMISTFDVLAVYGASNPQGIAEGISVALLTTMAGLVTSVAAMNIQSNLSKQIHRARYSLVPPHEYQAPLALSRLLRVRAVVLQERTKGES